MLRITSKLSALLFRLVMIVSLAGYSFSAVDAAMHPPGSVEISQVSEDHSMHGGGDHVAMSDSGHSDDAHDHGNSDKSKSSCCKDYCGVAAITCNGSAISHPRVSAVLEFPDDTDAVGQAPSLHRPPNI